MNSRQDAVAEDEPDIGAVGRTLLPRLLGYQLRRAQVAVFKHFEQHVGTEENITPGLFGMLQVIAGNPGMSQSRLAEAMEVDRSTIVTVVNQLESRGLVVREKSPTDRRSHRLALTAVGRAAIERIEAKVLRHEADFAKPLSAQERVQLVGLLARLYAGEAES